LVSHASLVFLSFWAVSSGCLARVFLWALGYATWLPSLRNMNCFFALECG